MTLRLLFYFLIFFGIACENSQQKEEIILAEVNDAVLTLQDAKSNISASEFNEDSVAAYNSYKNRWIERQLILEETKRLKLLDSPDVQRKVDRAKEEMLLISFQEAILSKLESDIIISDQEVRNYYQTNKDKFILEAAKRFIRGYEQVPETQDFAPQAYQPIAGDRWTIGWGSTRGVKEGDTVTREQAESRFDRDLQSAFSDFNSTVSKEIRGELGINESAAVISFLFNHGNTKRWRDSKARGHLNKLEIPEFVYELTDPVQGFVKAGEPGEKEIVDGLVNRRDAERKLFNTPDVDAGAGIGALSVNGYNDGGSTASGADVMRGFGISSLRDVKEMRKWLEAQAYGADLSA
ncbi:MAG TPA: hypothetical protein DEO59_17335, partial [Balneola sp.]|nr:hypothetical protein [Balneola sp.]